MASGFFCVTGPWHLELGVASGTHDGVERVIIDIQVVNLLDPLAQGFIGGKARRMPECLLQRRQHVWRNREGLASWHIYIQQRVQAARFVAREPVADGIAVDPQQLSHIQACLGLPAGQPVEHLEAWLLATLTFTL